MRLFKLLLAIALLPFVAAVCGGLLDLSRAAWAARDIGHPWFYGLGGGFALWLAVYLALPRPLWVYVWGHELTHALAVYLHAGTVYRFEVSPSGGHIISDRNNWLIALCPYFIPLYSMIWLGLWWSVDFYHSLHAYQTVLYAGIGLTWGFHATFTLSAIRDGQRDLNNHGLFFSLVLILLANLLLIEAGLVAMLPHTKFEAFAHLLRHRADHCYVSAGHDILRGVRIYVGWMKQFTAFMARIWHAATVR